MNYLFLGIILLLLLLTYLWLATKLSLFDKPNARSSHFKATIVGSGVIIPLSFVVWYFFFTPLPLLFFIPLLVISLVSFIDDIKPIRASLRFFIHIVCIGGLFWHLNEGQELTSTFSLFTIGLIAFFFLYWVNVFNFMDGINGITAAYSLVAFLTLWYINQFIDPFVDSNLLVISMIGVTVFGIFNFRNRAICFGGDVGSISLAFLLGYFLIRLLMASENWTYVFIFMIYFIDSTGTIIERILKRENIFTAHRLHLYQLYANEGKTKHLKISATYALVQLIFNVILLIFVTSTSNNWTIIFSISSLLVLATVFIFIKTKVFRSFKITFKEKPNTL